MKNARFLFGILVLGYIVFVLSSCSSTVPNSITSLTKNVKGVDNTVRSANRLVNDVKRTGSDIVNTTRSVMPDKVKQSNSTGKRPRLSEVKDDDFVQNSQNPARDTADTRYGIAKNLFIDVKGKYPSGYKPKWRFITYSSSLKFSREDWVRPKTNVTYDNMPLSIGSIDGKAVLRMKSHYDCECYADIIVKNSYSVLTSEPQTFEIANFRKVLNGMSTGEPCVGGMYPMKQGGKGGKITLSANQNGDLAMDLMLEYYTASETKKLNYNPKTKVYDRDVFMPSQVHYRYRAKGITIENEMTTTKANDVVAKEKEAKQKLKDYIEKTTKQADLLQKVIAKKYPQAECRSCFYSSRGAYISSTNVDEYYVQSGYYAGTRTDYDVNVTTTIKNKCNHPIIFIGIQQLHDEQNGYYLKEVTKVMEAGYSYSSDQGAMASFFTTLIGGGSEFNFAVQDKYAVNYASVGSVQWLKVIKSK